MKKKQLTSHDKDFDKDDKKTLVISKKVSSLIKEVHALNEDMFKVILKMGKTLNQLKAQLDKEGITTEQIEKEIPFTWRHAKNIMQVASCPILKDPNIKNDLPPSIGTLIEIVKMHDSKPKLFNEALNATITVKDGKDVIERQLIHPEMLRKDIESFRGIKVQGHGTKKTNEKNQITVSVDVSFKKNVSPDWLMNKVTKLRNVTEPGFDVHVDISKFKKYLTRKNTPFKKGKKSYPKR